MEAKEISRLLRDSFLFEPTQDQEYAIFVLSRFLVSNVQNPLLIVKGYAGTGKTSLISAIVKVVPQMGMEFVLLAPTGRASKVIAKYTGKYAYTIHKKIFTIERNSEGGEGFVLAPNRHKNTVFIIDEASMISGETQYYSGTSLLDDLIKYGYGNNTCRIIFIGDTAQLPPVGSSISPALNLDFLKSSYIINGAQVELKDVIRQEKDSGILANATSLRNTINDYQIGDPLFDLASFTDIIRLPGEELEEQLERCYSEDGWEETIILCRSNKRANIFNQQVRARIKWQEEEISTGDYMMVVKNNYHWLKKESKAGFIANGDTIEIMRLGDFYDRYGFRFVDATIRLVDYPDEPHHEVKLLLDTILSESPALTSEQNKQLYYTVLEDYVDVKNKTERMLKMREDPFYNALQVKFSYAVTCHKSQGGQWKSVFIDQGYLTEEMIDPGYIRWLYTAVTRATKRVFLINFNDLFFQK